MISKPQVPRASAPVSETPPTQAVKPPALAEIAARAENAVRLEDAAPPDKKATLTRPSPHLNPLSAVHFYVHPQMPELISGAQERGWFDRGFSQLHILWLELHYTTDGWKTVHVLRSTDVPCPVINGNFYLPNLPVGTEVEFALRVGYGARAFTDASGYRESAEIWFNNQGANYRQTTR